MCAFLISVVQSPPNSYTTAALLVSVHQTVIPLPRCWSLSTKQLYHCRVAGLCRSVSTNRYTTATPCASLFGYAGHTNRPSPFPELPRISILVSFCRRLKRPTCTLSRPTGRSARVHLICMLPPPTVLPLPGLQLSHAASPQSVVLTIRLTCVSVRLFVHLPSQITDCLFDCALQSNRSTRRLSPRLCAAAPSRNRPRPPIVPRLFERPNTELRHPISSRSTENYRCGHDLFAASTIPFPSHYLHGQAQI